MNNEYFRQRRAYFKRLGRCVRCGQIDDRTAAGKTQCRRCVEKNRRWAAACIARRMDLYYERRGAGLCPGCGKPRDRETVMCAACREKGNAAVRASRLKKREEQA